MCWTIKTRIGSVCIYYLLQYIKSRLCRVGRNRVYSLSSAAHTSAKISSTLLSAGICGNKQVRKLYGKTLAARSLAFRICPSSFQVVEFEGRGGGHASSDQSLFPWGLINYKYTRAKCRHLKKFTCKGTLRQVFIRVYRLEIQSVMLVFSTQLWEKVRGTIVHIVPLTFSLVHLPHFPPSLCQSTVCADSVGLGEGGGVESCWRPFTIFCRSLKICIWPDSGLQNCYTTPNRKLGGEGASDR